jgi:large subunit ribosomal protein L22
MKVVAIAKDVRITSRKARVVARSVVGLPVAEALVLLNFTPRHGAREVAKVIKSAVANAEHNFNLETSSLRIDRIEVDQAGIIKRYIAKPRGMAGSLFKRMSHLRCYVTDDEPEPERRRRSLVAMPGRATRASTRPAATRRRRPAQVRRAQEAAAAAAAEAAAGDEVPAIEGAEPEELGDAWGGGTSGTAGASPEDAGDAAVDDADEADDDADGDTDDADGDADDADDADLENEAPDAEPEDTDADDDEDEEPR